MTMPPEWLNPKGATNPELGQPGYATRLKFNLRNPFGSLTFLT